jgi:hypothetical protein
MQTFNTHTTIENLKFQFADLAAAVIGQFF